MKVMSHDHDTILVTGATGQQGGAVVRHLLSQGWSVRALVRDPQQSAAKAMERNGAELAVGDFADRRSLAHSMQGVYGVFSVQPAPLSPSAPVGMTPADEIQFGMAVADAARAAQVRHFVYSSVFAATRATGVQNAETKRAIEQHSASLGLPTTILRPTSFMENFFLPVLGITSGTRTTPVAPTTVEPFIAVDDIGALAAVVFGDRDRFIGQALPLAGDALTPPQTADAIARAIGRPFLYRPMSLADAHALSPQFAKAMDWLNTSDQTIDIATLRALHPGLLTFEGWLKAGGAQRLSALIGSAS
jgi:uncharacterized protein YbjT (DUF2867 family)